MCPKDSNRRNLNILQDMILVLQAALSKIESNEVYEVAAEEPDLVQQGRTRIGWLQKVASEALELTGLERVSDKSLDQLSRFRSKAREKHRLKWACDYSITYKFKRWHLLCSEVFVESLEDVGREVGIEFSTIYTYR